LYPSYSLILASYASLLKHKQDLVAGLVVRHYPVRIFTDCKSKSFTWRTHIYLNSMLKFMAHLSSWTLQFKICLGAQIR